MSVPKPLADVLPKDPEERARLIRALAAWVLESERTEDRRSKMRGLK